MNDYGVAVAPGTVRLERVLPGPIDRVWAYLTDPEKRGSWLAKGPMDLYVGGAVRLEFVFSEYTSEATPAKYASEAACGHAVEGEVTVCEPPQRLAFSWSEAGHDPSEVTFELTPRDGDVHLVVTHRRLPHRKGMVSVAGGWHIHLGILADRLAGVAPRAFWAAHLALEPEYATRFDALLEPADTVTVQVSRVIEAPAERVFDAWLDPDRASRFLFATPGGQMVRAEIDPRVGGRFCFVDRRGRDDVEHRGEYLAIDRPRLIAFTFSVDDEPDGASHVAVDFAPSSTGTRVTITHTMDKAWADYRGRVESGWSSIFEALESAINVGAKA